MLTKRLIACFDVVDGRVTKAQQFQDNIDVAPAEGLAERLYDDQIDEIVFYDILASAQRRKIDLDTVRRVARHVFVPFTVGGGIRTIDDIDQRTASLQDTFKQIRTLPLEQIKALSARGDALLSLIHI